MPGDPLQAVLGGSVPFDATEHEVESRAELDAHLAMHSLSGLVILGLQLDLDPPDFAGLDVRGTLFVGCRFASAEVEVDLIRRGALIVPPFRTRPYGIVFAPGWAGTVQEVFQAATKTFYQTDGPSGAFVFLGTAHWSALGVEALLRPLLARSPHGDQSRLIVVTDSLDEAMTALSPAR
jgi:hypothetical protein